MEVTEDVGEPFMTEQQAGELVKLRPQTLAAYRVKGGGPRYWIVGRKAVRYLASDLRAWARPENNTSEREAQDAARP